MIVMNESIKLLLSLSLSGSILALIILMIKSIICNKLSKIIQYYIWVIVLLRFIMPFSFQDSIMNNIFYNNEKSIESNNVSSSNDVSSPQENTVTENNNKSLVVNNNKSNVINEVNTVKSSREVSIIGLINKYVLHIWLFVAFIIFTFNILSYIKYLKHIKKGYVAVGDEENNILHTLLNSSKEVKFSRNRYVDTPIILGILKPTIVIPNNNYSKEQIKNILRHEITHLKHYDIHIKWLTMIVTSLHWFNPIVYFLKKEINHTCELACDETVIKDLSSLEKQCYGETLISVVEDYKCHKGVLQVTMYEEKNSLKERLLAIMNYKKKSKFILITSIIIISSITIGALYLGAGVGKTPEIITEAKNNEYNLSDILEKVAQHKTPYIGNHVKVGNIAGWLPIPHDNFMQRYTSMKTSERPYSLTIYYELVDEDNKYVGEWPITTPNSLLEVNSKRDALIAFSMIDNADIITFAFRNSKSGSELDQSAYNTTFTFNRSEYEEIYGDLTLLGDDLNQLKKELDSTKKNAMIILSKEWAESLKSRDGKIRFELMSKELKNKFIEGQKEQSGSGWNYNIGYLSPWVVDYNISIKGMKATINYTLKDSIPAEYSQKEIITFKEYNGKLVVDNVEDSFEGLMTE